MPELADLITIEQLQERLGRELGDPELTRALTAIGDSSALVRLIAFGDETGWDDGAPRAVIPVVVSMVRRALENPRGLSGEQIGAYAWQASTRNESVYATAEERRIIRRAAGKLSVGTVTLEGHLIGHLANVLGAIHTDAE